MAEGEDRTQAASERRLARAREEGQAPLSRDLVQAAGMAATALVLILEMPSLPAALMARLRGMLLAMDATPGRALEEAALTWLGATGPLLLTILVIGAMSVLLQTGFVLRRSALFPDFGRLDLRRGLGRLFSLDHTIEVVKSLIKLGLLAWVLWTGMSEVWPDERQALLWLPSRMADRLGEDIVRLLLLVLGCQLGIALLDVTWTRWRFSQRLRMSREEVKQEQKEADGDPRIKARLKQIRQARAKRRILAAVRNATVVITNPTHYAVALAYERGMQAAPRVVAKGMDEMAWRIRDAATASGVPLVANPPLARALYQVALDAEVPAEHFKVVAEIIAYVWRLKGVAPRR